MVRLRTYDTVLHVTTQVLDVKCGEGHSMLLLEVFPKPKTEALVTWVRFRLEVHMLKDFTLSEPNCESVP